MDVPINYFAVLAAAISAMVLGFLWFGPLFGRLWVEASGMDMAKVAEAQKRGAAGMWKSYLLQILGALCMSYVLAHSIVFAAAYTGAVGIAAGLMGGFWNWLGFVVPVSVGQVLWDNKSWTYWMITSGYYLVTLLVMGTILALWI